MSQTSGQQKLKFDTSPKKLQELLLDNSADPVFCLDADGRHLFVNHAFAAAMGKPKIELIGKTIEELFPEEASLVRRSALDQAFRQMAPLELEVDLSEGQKTRTFLIRIIPYYLPTDKASPLALCYAKETTEIKYFEAALLDSRQRLQDVIEFFPDAVIGINQEKQVIIWNKAMEKMSGISACAILGQGNHAYSLPFYGQRRPFLMEVLLRNAPSLFDHYDNVTENADAISGEAFCPELYQKKGAWIYARAALLRDSQGGIIGAIESVRDITQRKEAELALRESQSHYQSLIELAVDGIMLGSHDGHITEANQCICQMLGMSKPELLGKHISELAFTPESIQRSSWRFDLLQQGETVVSERDILRPDGKVINIEMRTKMLPDGTYQSIYRDITQRNSSEKRVRESEQRMAEAQAMAHIGNWEMDLASQLITFSAEAGMIFGLPKAVSTISKTQVRELILPEYHDMLEKNSRKLLRQGHVENIEYQLRREDTGEIRHIRAQARLAPAADGTKNKVVGTIQDITAYKKNEEEIVYLSYHDQLTGLYNRRFYEEELRRLAVKRNLPLSIAMGDVNGLKLINDSFGHQMGDQLLCKVAQVLNAACRADDIVARLGGDEFVILLPKTGRTDAEQIIQRIYSLMASEKVGTLDVSISFGFETKESEATPLPEIIKSVEDKMYRRKLYESSSMRSRTIDLIMNTLYEKSQREMLHSKRVGDLCAAIAAEMNFTRDDVNQLRAAGLMHDIGKMGIDEKILNKPEQLSPEEWKLIDQHPEIGYRILSTAREFSEIADYILEHQEKWDGSGYPQGLQGEEICLQARIIAVADAFDAMNSDRAYRKRLSAEQAAAELQRCAGSQFDPEIVEVLVKKVLKI